MSLKDLDCNKVSSIKDIQEAGTYIDKTGSNKETDRENVSCLQQYYKNEKDELEPYNELAEFTKSNFPKIITDYYKKLCLCCKEKSNQKWSWDHLKKCIIS